jgi:hypothetical protein
VNETKLGKQNQFSCGFSGFEIAVSLSGIGERISMLDAKFKFAGGDPAQNIVGAMLEFLTSSDVVNESWAGEEQRAFLRKLDQIEGRHCSARSAEEDKVAAGTEYIEVLVEGVLADSVVNNVNALAFGKAFGLLRKILFAIEDNFVGSSVTGELSFVGSSSGADNTRANHLCHLHGKKADSSGRSMDECNLSAFEWVRAVDEVMSCHALKHGSGSFSEIELIGDLDETIGGHDGIFGVTAEASSVGDAITCLDRGDPGTDFCQDAGGFLPVDERKLRGIATFAEVDVDEINADRFDLNERFVRAGLGCGKVDQGENFRTAGLLNLNGFHNGD